MPNSLCFSPNIAILTAGQLVLPDGFKGATVVVVSGGAFINGTGPIPAPSSFSFGRYDGRVLARTGFAIGCTGGLTIVSYDL